MPMPPAAITIFLRANFLTGNRMTSKKYKSVVEMVRACSDDQEFVDGFERHSADRRLAGSLFAVRAAKGLSQKDIAERLWGTQSRISKLENSDDSSFRLGDLAAYVKALGLHFRLVLSKRDETIVEQVKYHAICIKKLLDQLARLAQDDKRIAGGVSAFFGESFFNMIRML